MQKRGTSNLRLPELFTSSELGDFFVQGDGFRILIITKLLAGLLLFHLLRLRNERVRSPKMSFFTLRKRLAIALPSSAFVSSDRELVGRMTSDR